MSVSLYGSGQTVIQAVVGSFTGNSFSTTSSSFVSVTGFSATITPQSTTSKILVMLTTSSCHVSTTSQGEYRVLRNGSDPAMGSSGYMWTSDGYYGSTTVQDAATTYLDSPSSTSALTYQVQIRNRQGNTMVVGEDWNGNTPAGVHTLVLLEISGS